MIALRRAFLPVLLFGGLLTHPLRGEEPARPAQKAELQKPIVNWPARLREWRKWYTAQQKDEAKTREAARAQIEAIEDQEAIPAIIALLKTEKEGQFRRVLILPLIKFGGKDAVAMLVKLSVEDDNGALREEAARGLVGKQELPQFLDKYIDYLYKPQFSAAAAQALRWNQLAVRDSVGVQLDPKLTKALIAALVQKHKKLVPYWWAVDTGRMPGLEESTIDFATGKGVDRRDAYGLAGSRSGRFAAYREGWVQVLVPEANKEAYQTLKEYTYQDYQYDQKKWSANLGLGKAR